MLAQFYPPIIGGEERHVRNLSVALARRGHEVTVATLHRPGLPDCEIDDGVKVRRLRGTMQRLTSLFSDSDRPHAPPFPDPELTQGIARVVASDRPEMVHAHNWLLHSFLPLKRSGGPRLAVTLHDLSLICARKSAMYAGAPCKGPGLTKCLSCAAEHYGALKGTFTALSNWGSAAVERHLVDKFIAVSNAIATGNGLHGGRIPFEVVPNFVPDDVAVLGSAPSHYIDQLPASGYVLFVGDLRELKGVKVLIDAYASLELGPRWC